MCLKKKEKKNENFENFLKGLAYKNPSSFAFLCVDILNLSW